MQYRGHFISTVLSSLAHTFLFLIFIETVLGNVPSIGTWSRPSMYVAYGTFVLVYALAQFGIEPNISALTDGMRQGELDYVLTKPIDAQAFISLRSYRLTALADVLTGSAIVVYGLMQLSTTPTWLDVLEYTVVLLCGLAIVYSLWLLSVLYVFKAIRVDSIAVLFIPILQFARYPISVYPIAFQTIFRFVIPLVFVATVPAESLLGHVGFSEVISGIATAFGCLVLTRVGWIKACRSYTSASS
jgi:ABC-2 type transport system permease protein